MAKIDPREPYIRTGQDQYEPETPRGRVNQHGSITLTWNPHNGYPLLSPDKTVQLLVCEDCGEPMWVDLCIVSFFCKACICQYCKAPLNHCDCPVKEE